jgi:hypothetical protein
MSFWMWVLTVLGGLVILLVLLFAWGTIYLRRRSMLDEQQLTDDPGRLRKLADAGDTAALLQALNSPSDTVSAEAARALAPFNDPMVTAMLLHHYFEPSKTNKEPYADALATRPAEDVVPHALEKLGKHKEELAIELLRRFDVPAAQAAVAKFDEARESARAALARRQQVLEQLLSAGAEAARTTLQFPLPIETGGGAAVSKIVAGMFSGGVGAVTPNKFCVDDLVRLPDECAFCGCARGKKERWAKNSFQLASAGWGFAGVNTMAEAFLTYRICAECVEHDEKTQAILLLVEKQEPQPLTLRLEVLNPGIAAQIHLSSPDSNKPEAT